MSESSIAWVDGALVILDQRVLPHEVRELRITTVDQVIDAIKTLAVRGAPAIGVSGAFGVVLAAFAHPGDSAKVEAEAERIASARPTAVNLAWGVRRALTRLPEGAPAVLDEALAMLEEDGRVNRAAATHAADLIQRLCPDRPLRILTHCNTGRLATAAFGTALGAVRVLAARDAVETVLVDETRPLLQGARLTAWELAEAGIPHRLTIDSAAAWAMSTGQVDCVVVGADRITADGSVANKIGTYALAIAAHHHGIPFVVVAPESTRDPKTATGGEIVVEQRAADEITQLRGVATAPAGTAVFNPAFDVTPPDLVTAVVTEHGIVSGTANAAAAEEDSGVGRNSARSAENGRGEAAERIAETARGLYARGWMPGTAGNISVRAGDTAVVTGSGLSKGELTAADMVTVNIADSQPISGTRRPSAETAIHTAVYRATGADAVVHVHPPHATARSVGARESLRFSGYELIKGLRASETIDIPVFANHPDVPRIGADIERYLTEHPDAPPVLFIAGHGITAWGEDLAQARDRAECLEAMCELVTLTGRREIEEDPK
ncbi:S-methyl-5-thioribose-1-phosphate isomerase [Nocardia terpenica]|uniref:S-methyl-5-thioribose-1-phosphate isomerase n=1 Tax=Nocardia terpenica TaxID=455432 RepID=UPI001892EAFE|nr:S-methyl-5-thioribose-1-phosphate isomerase [Nocardia terpenica]MBF6061194.1 S-methyl-5-thioribose-1-phosphate isomerase [Nocardia terpenica]MBF6105577.1 S-methyl-5-thioribose-1-phosphate isomerase [Nocardia terpenica]MBF6112953.1 S-methyl-5-thioribose-1-phosphate isomerase [Nocardia terpenica]MBF6119083.1 S-methyl-5-thioribose-1-phosphate isomerase [Nocardia terpenica]MBF6152731.1 S-methyl-5-thioribose-1-phosphate isomerase [Nocardia terpenica]